MFSKKKAVPRFFVKSEIFSHNLEVYEEGESTHPDADEILK